MTYRELAVPGAWEVCPVQHTDARGVFFEAFQAEPLAALIGHRFDLRQANCSVSAAGVVRGVHFSDVPPGQAKYVTCLRGAVLDVAVDLRVGSPTFGRWDSVLLDDIDCRAVYLSEGLGHAFLSLEDNSTVMYLCSSAYTPGREHGIDPFDPQIAIAWPMSDRRGNAVSPFTSVKDAHAPSLAEAKASGVLPRYEETTAYLAALGD